MYSRGSVCGAWVLNQLIGREDALGKLGLPFVLGRDLHVMQPVPGVFGVAHGFLDAGSRGRPQRHRRRERVWQGWPAMEEAHDASL